MRTLLSVYICVYTASPALFETVAFVVGAEPTTRRRRRRYSGCCCCGSSSFPLMSTNSFLGACSLVCVRATCAHTGAIEGKLPIPRASCSEKPANRLTKGEKPHALLLLLLLLLCMRWRRRKIAPINLFER